MSTLRRMRRMGWLAVALLALPLALDIGIEGGWAAEAVPGDAAEAERVLNLCREHLAKEPQKAIESCQAAAKLYQQLGDLKGESNSLNNLGEAYDSLGQYLKAIESFQQSLAIARELGDRKWEANALNNLGIAYYSLGQYSQAIEFHQQSLAISREIRYRKGEANALNNLGIAYNSLGQYPKAIEFLQKALAIYRELGDRKGEVNTLGNLASAYDSPGQYPKAIEFYQQSLAIYREIGNRKGEANILNNLGSAYDSLSQYLKAIEFYQQSLTIAREIGYRLGEGHALNNLGIAYNSLGQYPKAIESFQKALAIKRELGDRKGESASLNNLGEAYRFLSQYPKAIEFYQQSLAIYRELGDRKGEAASLNNLGISHHALGQYPKAIEFHQQSLAIKRELGDRQGEANTLNNLGNASYSLGQVSKAIEFFQQSLAIAREIGDRKGESASLGNLGEAYRFLSQYPKAIEFYQQSLAIAREIGDRKGEANALNNLGIAYNSLGQVSKAIEFFQQSLAIAREIGDVEGEGITLSNIGNTLTKLNNPLLAIIFLKQSVNVREGIRTNLKPLNRDLQQSYINTIAGTYRNLANLLLQQNRVMEALEVLDLLKVQELRNYLNSPQANNNQPVTTIELFAPEQTIWTQFNALKTADSSFFQSANIQTLVTQIQQQALQLNQSRPAYLDVQTRLQKLGQNLALFYPLILEDRLELILLRQNQAPIHRSVPIPKTQLEPAIAQFLNDLQNPKTKAVYQSAQQLYDWLIKPLEADLAQAQVQTLVYAPDGQMRYVPLTALYDGKQWLAQRYQVNYLTALALTPLAPPSPGSPSLLAGAFTQGTYTIQTAGRSYPFSGLTHGQPEIDNLAQTIPNSKLLINQAFNRQAVETNLPNHNLIHMATHAVFIPGAAENSFIVLGDGTTINLTDIDQWTLPNVKLFVLSACETALGEQLGNGLEILGFGYQLQRTGVRASISTLWKVNDNGTQLFMERFYTLLQSGKLSPVAAMRQTQEEMLSGSEVILEAQRRADLGDLPSVGSTPPPSPSDTLELSHPYFWAPFILIGNGL
jgi:CHAT domain-containing protein/Tfp pilus assembly protein PilF